MWKFKHWLCNTRFYNIYCWAKARCEKPSSNVYHLYWWKWIKFERKTFEDFMNDMYESYVDHVKQYWEKQTTIERIDSDKSYCKENCKRATCKEQSNNISRNKKVEYNGKVYNSISLMCDDLWLRYNLINSRLNRWWSVKEAVETTELKKRIHDKQCKKVLYNGKEYYSIMELARNVWVNYKIISRRLGCWWTIEDAIERPLDTKHSFIWVKTNIV